MRLSRVSEPDTQLRAFAEVYAFGDADAAFVREFVAAWSKVMS